MSEDIKNLLGLIAGTILTIVTGGVVWLIKTVLGSEKDIITLRGKMEVVESGTSRLEDEMDELRKSQITTECVRDVVDEVLDRRDRIAEGRQKEKDELQAMRMEKAASDAIDKALPKIVREVSRAATGSFPKPKPSELPNLGEIS